MEENTLHPEETGLADELHSFIQHEQATQGQRFLNWLIDNILLRLVIQFITGEIFIKILLNIAPDYTIRVFTENSFETYLIAYLIAICHYIFYYTICEKAFKGHTLGKLITGTRAIRMDGQELTLKDAFLRSLSRMVPFEVFSGFGDKPWHDNWTKTVVVKAR